jgi:hypothetical protein
MLVQMTQTVQQVVFHWNDVGIGGERMRSMLHFTMRNARLLEAGTRKGAAFIYSEELGRGFGSVFHL